MENNTDTEVNNTPIELEPASVDNTEVKIPVSDKSDKSSNVSLAKKYCDSQTDFDIDINVSPMISNSNRELRFDSELDFDTPADEADYTEYQRLLALLQELPASMFVDQLLVDYANCEQKLEQTRLMLFEFLRSADDFPFGSSDLKRRLTRHGDSAAVKLAYDIHEILGVLEGGDYMALKDMISSAKRTRNSTRKTSVSRNTFKTQSDHSACNAEINKLKETISSMQADLLLIKQRQAAIENMRISDNKQLKDSLKNVNSDLVRCDNRIVSDVQDFKQSISVFQTSISADVRACKTDLLQQLQSLQSLQQHMSYVSNMFVQTQQTVANICNHLSMSVQEPNCITTSVLAHQSGDAHNQGRDPPLLDFKDTVSVRFCNEPTHPAQQDLVAIPCPTEPFTPVQPGATSDNDISALPTHQESNSYIPPDNERNDETKTYASVLCAPPPVNQMVQDEQNSEFPSIPTRITTRKNDSERQANKRRKIRRGGNWSKQQNNRQTGLLPEIHVHENAEFEVTDLRNDVAFERNVHTHDEDDFSQFVRRRTRRFYIGGFLPTITEAMIANYVSKRGPKVTNVTIFRNKRYNRATIRLNVEDDEKANRLTNDSFFWPRGITCRPWLPRNEYKSRENINTQRRFDNRNRRYDLYESDDFMCENRYDVLESRDDEVD